jgi:hypothetical protein
MTRDAEPGVLRSPDFLALGLGGTNMMSMLWTVATGRKAVGVEMRGDPFLGVHWNLREDLFHQLGLIDQMMLERYGEDGVPRRANGTPFRLAECFYAPETAGGDIVADEVIDGFDIEQHIVGTIHDVEFIDDRWRDGLPNRVITILDPPEPPERPDATRIRTSMVDVLDGPSTFQAEAASIQKLLRRYLELMEHQDRQAGREPRVQLFTHHRVAPDEDEGFVREPDGRLRIRIEALQEFDYKGRFVRVREPGSELIDLGVPELIMIAEGANSSDAKRLGFEQHDVEVDHEDGRGPVVAQADFLAGLVEVLVGGRLRRRISSEFDESGREYWVRQIAVGHENDPEVGWVLCQVPDFKTFDPVEAGLIPADTETDSPQFFAAYQHMLYEYYIKHAADVLEIPRDQLSEVQMVYGPKLFSLIERVGEDAQVAANAVVAGDTFGNGHFLTSGGAMTGMIGHSARVLAYWEERDAGSTVEDALRRLADRIAEDTHGWLHVSAKEYSQAVPINFGAERIEQISEKSGIAQGARAEAIEAARRQRHDLIPLNPSDWRRLFVHNGKVISELPELDPEHPLKRPERAATLYAVMKSLPEVPGQANAVVMPTRNVTRLISTVTEGSSEGTPFALRKSRLIIGRLRPQSAATHASLEIYENGSVLDRVVLTKTEVVIGRTDEETGIVPEVDLSAHDPQKSVSRRHALIHGGDSGYSLEDLNSRNKTRVRDRALEPGERATLRDGDVIDFGSVKTRFRLLGKSGLPDGFSAS